jgi:hypothetical protein
LDSLNYRNADRIPKVDESGLGSVDDGFGKWQTINQRDL